MSNFINEREIDRDRERRDKGKMGKFVFIEKYLLINIEGIIKWER